jgi:hypothetical protein
VQEETLMVGHLEFPFRLFLRKSSIFALILLLAVVGGSRVALGAGFRASVVKIDITPSDPQWLSGHAPRKSDGVHDHLFHRIIATDDGKTQFFLVSTDICLYSPKFYDEVMREIEEQTGVKPIQIWWTVTHSAGFKFPSLVETGAKEHSWHRQIVGRWLPTTATIFVWATIFVGALIGFGSVFLGKARRLPWGWIVVWAYCILRLKQEGALHVI